MILLEKCAKEIDDHEALSIQKLIYATWPSPKSKYLSDQALIREFKERSPGKTSYLLYLEIQLVGYAETFYR